MASVKSVPLPFREPPPLNPDFRPKEIASRHSLLVNPFYRKDPHASFGKHVRRRAASGDLAIQGEEFRFLHIMESR